MESDLGRKESGCLSSSACQFAIDLFNRLERGQAKMDKAESREPLPPAAPTQSADLTELAVCKMKRSTDPDCRASAAAPPAESREPKAAPTAAPGATPDVPDAGARPHATESRDESAAAPRQMARKATSSADLGRRLGNGAEPDAHLPDAHLPESEEVESDGTESTDEGAVFDARRLRTELQSKVGSLHPMPSK